MNIQSLVGFVLEGCRFSKSSYTFELSGTVEGQFSSVLASTAFGLTFGDGDRSDVCSDFSAEIWPMLELKIAKIEVRSDDFEVIFEFDGGGSFTIWSDGPPADNLLLVSRTDGSSWFTVL